MIIRIENNGYGGRIFDRRIDGLKRFMKWHESKLTCIFKQMIKWQSSWMEMDFE
jgi:hypothetical protein